MQPPVAPMLSKVVFALMNANGAAFHSRQDFNSGVPRGSLKGIMTALI